jgi:ethanolamine ammonia-lyase large subunit
VYSATLGGTRYGFPDLKTLLAKASSKRSGDALDNASRARLGAEPRGSTLSSSSPTGYRRGRRPLTPRR